MSSCVLEPGEEQTVTKKQVAQVFFWTGLAVGLTGLAFNSMSGVLLGGVLFVIALSIPFPLETTQV